MQASARSRGERRSAIGVVNTVGGGRDTRELGAVLMHEHVFVHTPEISRDYPDLSWGDKEAAISSAVAALADAAAAEIGTVVDLTVIGCDRAIPELSEVAERVDVNIVVATGLYAFDELPRFARARPPGRDEEDVLTEMFIRDIAEGIGGTPVRAGVLKACTDAPGMTDGARRVTRAVARAQLETGVPISTHTDAARRTGIAQQDVLAEEGVDLSRVVIGHCDDTTDLDYLRQIMDRGSCIGCDRFGLYRPGTPGMAERVDVIARLCREGYADRIVLSHDTHCQSDWFGEGFRAAYPDWEYTHVPTAVVPALRASGVSDGQLRKLMVENPRRILDPVIPAQCSAAGTAAADAHPAGG